jgi:hypothetical protein
VQEPEPQHDEAEAADVSDTVEEAPVAEPEETPGPEIQPVAAEPLPEAEARDEPEPPPAVQGDTEDDLPPVAGEDTSDIPIIVSDPEPAPPPAPQRAAGAAPAAPRRPERPTRKPPRQRSLMPRILAASAVVVGAAAVAAYFLLSGGSSKPPEGRFQGAGAPVGFTYPSELVARRPPRGGLLKPTFSTAVGVNGANYVVVATYKISADVQSDGSAIGTGGSRLTADRFDESVDRAAERIASAQKLKAKGSIQPGKAGDLVARIYTYTRPDGSSARYAFAFRGHTEYSIACFWDPAHATQLSAACAQVMTSLQRT